MATVLTEFQDSLDGPRHDAFQQWRKRNPLGVLLTVESRTRANLHGAGCQHLGNTDWTVEPETLRHSLTKKRKVCAESIDPLLDWAVEHQVDVQHCMHCVRDGLVPERSLPWPLKQKSHIRVRADTTVASVDQTLSATVDAGHRYSFRVGRPYTRKDVYRFLGLPETTKGGNWDTGYTSFGRDFFIFCGVGARGRTGHDYGNHFDGDRLVWFGKTGSSRSQPSIQRMLNPEGAVYVFFREEERSPFTFAGLATPHQVFDQVPVKVVWDLSASPGERLPTQLPEELDDGLSETVLEGARRTISVNVYERDPNARRKCIARWGLKCSVCSFDFAETYGELGEGFIHVHHLKPLGEIGERYELNPVADLRPVCPNCHAMLHSKKPALSIEDLMIVLSRKSPWK